MIVRESPQPWREMTLAAGAVPFSSSSLALRRWRSELGLRERVGAGWQGDRWGDLVFTDEAGGPPSGFHVSRCFRALLA